MAKLNNATGGENLDIKVLTQPVPISWNMEDARQWAADYAAQWGGVKVTDENLPEMKNAAADLGHKIKRLDEIRLEHKRAYLVPLTQFEADIKTVAAELEKVRAEITKQTDVYTERRRNEKRDEAAKIIADAVASFELRPEFAAQLAVQDGWTILSITKAKVKKEITEAAASLRRAQDDADDRAEMARQKVEMVDSLLAAQSAAFRLSVPLSRQTMSINLDATLTEITNIITAAAAKQRDAEEAAVRAHEERAKAEAERKEAEARAKELARTEAEKRAAIEAEENERRAADAKAAQEAVERIERERAAAEAENRTPDFRLFQQRIIVIATNAELDLLMNSLKTNGWTFLDKGRVQHG